MFAVPLGCFRYQNSASLLVKEDIAFVSDVPPNVTEVALLSLDSIPTTSVRLVPTLALKLEIVTLEDGNNRVADVDLTLFEVMPLVALAVCGCTRFNGIACEIGTRANMRMMLIQKKDLFDFSDMDN